MTELNAQQVAKELAIGMLGRSHMQISAPELRALLAERRELLARQVPERWVMVPRNPTAAMESAGAAADSDNVPSLIWAAMVNAAQPQS